MSLDHTTSQELTLLARGMLNTQSKISDFKNLGVLVRQDSDEFKEREGKVIAFGEIDVDSVKFVYFTE